MRPLLRVSAVIDVILSKVAIVGAYCGLLLVVVVCFDVATRYFSVPKPFGLNSTQIQESEYWLHAILFSLLMGYAYIRQAHVRIDLLRDQCSRRVKFIIEIIGIAFFLLTYSTMGVIYSYSYALTSFIEGEVSNSTIGLSNLWILKSMVPLLFVLLFLSGISNLIKCLAALGGALPEERHHEVLGGGH